MAEKAYKSERTKLLEKAKIDEDMSGIKKAVRGVSLTASRAMDKVEGAFKKKEQSSGEALRKEEPKKKMAVGGSVSKDKKFKACASCPNPAKCKAAGTCLAKKVATVKKPAKKK